MVVVLGVVNFGVAEGVAVVVVLGVVTFVVDEGVHGITLYDIMKYYKLDDMFFQALSNVSRTIVSILFTAKSCCCGNAPL